MLHWEWVAGHAHPERRFDDAAAVRDAQSAADLVGYLNSSTPYRVQIVGRREVAYLSASARRPGRRIARIVTLEPPVIVVADGVTAARAAGGDVRPRRDPAVRHRRVRRSRDRRRSRLPRPVVRRRITRHGVFMDILGLGVLLTGESGLGKSELGLELISLRPRPGGRRRGRPLPRVADRARRAAARRCCRTCSRCAASACWTSRPSSARPRCVGRCG